MSDTTADKDTELALATADLDILGIGFLIDGRRIDPTRVSVLTAGRMVRLSKPEAEVIMDAFTTAESEGWHMHGRFEKAVILSAIKKISVAAEEDFDPALWL
ncbi:MAG TPA: hypothetical protein VGH15_05785 [Caulobacteraceae bacterium]|jgi:hypothetical protein